MLKEVVFLSRLHFEDLSVSSQDAVVSIGDHLQALPEKFADYSNDQRLRIEFLDLDLDDCEEHNIDPLVCMQPEQADLVVGFLRRLHASSQAFRLRVHCEAGASRSAAVALAAAKLADIDPIGNLSGANRHVVRMLSDRIGVDIAIPTDVFDEDPAAEYLRKGAWF